MAFEIRRVGQYEIGERDGFRSVRVDIDDVRNAVFAACRVAVAEHAPRLGRVHRRVPAHVRHEQQQRVDAVRIAGPRVADHALQHAVRGERVLPRERLVDAARRAVCVDEQILGRLHVAERRCVERAVRLARLAGTIAGRRRFRIRRLVAEAARRVDRAEQHLQEMQRAARVKAVRMRRDAAHRVHRDRAADHLRVLAAVRVGPASAGCGSPDRTRFRRARARGGGSCRRGRRRLRRQCSARIRRRDSARQKAGKRVRRSGRRRACIRRR